MKKISGTFLFICIIVIGGYAQTSSSFTYKNKPVTPEAFVQFLEGQRDYSVPDSVDLNSRSFKQRVELDTIYFHRPRSEKMYVCWQEERGYVDYIVKGRFGDKFIVLARYNGGGSYTDVGIFFVTIKGHKLYKLGGFVTPNISDYKIVIKGDAVTYKGKTYKVPD